MKKWINELYDGLENEIGVSDRIVLYKKEQSLSRIINEKISEQKEEFKRELFEYHLGKRKDFILKVGTVEDYEKWYTSSDFKEEVSSMFEFEEEKISFGRTK